MSPDREQADLLLRKATDDQAVLTALVPSDTIADAVLGFHAQQAAEKAMKAVLAAAGVDFPWTHDLQLLLGRLEAAGVEVPEGVSAARRLSPWAVEYRYGETIDEALDRPGAAALVNEVLTWASEQVQRQGGE